MISKKISLAVKLVVALLCVVLALGLGLLFGYKYILNQDARFKRYDAQVLAAELAKQSSATTAAETEEGEEGAETTKAPSTTTTVRLQERVVVDEFTPGNIMVYIAMGDSTKDIAKKLADKGVIDSVTLFTIFSKFNGFDGSYKFGTHFVLKNMSYDQVMYILSQQPATRTIRFQDELTYADVKRLLKENTVNFNEEKLDKLVADPRALTDFDFVREIPSLNPNYDPIKSGKRDNALQGYLFPDTYRFDMNADEETIIRTFLNNTENKLSKEMYERAEKIGMTMDQVITMASIIQKESGDFDDMCKVSRVFHNRLAEGMRLQSDATVNYIRKRMGKTEEYYITGPDLEINDPYNSYIHEGLPPGPICSPGIDAIMAALYPNSESAYANILYFVADGQGTNVYANTAEGHQENLDKYFHPSSEGGN